MHSLYTRLAQYWDQLFPADPGRIGFIRTLVDPAVGTDIVELGCGTGATARDLAIAGFRVEASDPDTEMIDIAKEHLNGLETNVLSSGAELRYRVDDMIGALAKSPDGELGAVLCLGNTLPHLNQDADVSTFFSESRRVLAKDGALVVQILNYSKIMAVGEMTLPELKAGELVFRRRQSYDKNAHIIRFHTEVSSGTHTEKRVHQLNPLSARQLEDFSVQAGFTKAAFYKNWERDPFEGENPWFVAVFR